MLNKTSNLGPLLRETLMRTCLTEINGWLKKFNRANVVQNFRRLYHTLEQLFFIDLLLFSSSTQCLTVGDSNFPVNEQKNIQLLQLTTFLVLGIDIPGHCVSKIAQVRKILLNCKEDRLSNCMHFVDKLLHYILRPCWWESNENWANNELWKTNLSATSRPESLIFTFRSIILNLKNSSSDFHQTYVMF